ncbi:MAG: hypothetical protein IT561_19395 [Alphaproteobacteria bacterium]|nr:hypothetical protein [Alphaproteobacteria bacterium]
MRKAATTIAALAAVIFATGVWAAPVRAADGHVQIAQAAPPRPQVMAEKQTYQPFEPILVRWTGMMAPTFYVLLKRPDAERPITSYIATGGAVGERYRDGSYQFPGQLPGDYMIEARAGSDDKGYLRARGRVTVVDPNEEPPATQGAGAPQPGAAPPSPQAAATLPPPTLPVAGGRFGLKFTDPPTPVDFGQFTSVLAVVQQGTSRRCASAGEGFGWNVSVREDARIRRLYAEAADAMMARRYTLSQLALQYPNAYAYRAENAAAQGADRALLLAWYFAAAAGSETGTLYLVVCPTE